MSGPIVRTGASAKFSENWDRIFSAPTTKSKTKSADKPAKAAKAAAVEATKAAPTAKAKAGKSAKAAAKPAAKGKSKK